MVLLCFLLASKQQKSQMIHAFLSWVRWIPSKTSPLSFRHGLFSLTFLLLRRWFLFSVTIVAPSWNAGTTCIVINKTTKYIHDKADGCLDQNESNRSGETSFKEPQYVPYWYPENMNYQGSSRAHSTQMNTLSNLPFLLPIVIVTSVLLH